MTYEEFLFAKLQAPPSYGFSIAKEEVNPILKPHQREAGDTSTWKLTDRTQNRE